MFSGGLDSIGMLHQQLYQILKVLFISNQTGNTTNTPTTANNEYWTYLMNNTISENFYFSLSESKDIFACK